MLYGDNSKIDWRTCSPSDFVGCKVMPLGLRVMQQWSAHTGAHVEFEVLRDGADGGEVGGVVEVFLHRLRCDLTKFVLHSFSNTHGVHGDSCVHAQQRTSHA